MNRFLEEILEQPEAIERVVEHYTSGNGIQTLEKVKSALRSNEFEQTIFTGMGSSYFVSQAASCLFNSMNIHTFAVNTSELLHYNLSLFSRKTLLICISQSGESIEILELLNKLPATVYCVGITNEEESTLAKRADAALLCKGGKEEMTSTKTYVLTSLVSFMLGWHLAGTWNEEKIRTIRHLGETFRSKLMNYSQWLEPVFDFLGDIETLQIIARGPAFSTASQSALMFKEALKIPASGMLGGEFRHGPMEMVSEGFKAIVFASRGKTLAQGIKMAEDLARFHGKVLLITNRELSVSDLNILQIHINEPDEYLFSVAGIIPVQLFIDAYAKLKGFEAGSFSRGAKVTVNE
jgi:glucosamine--fructose-6-phosphate aminotransferase (isomerizing)